MENIWASPRFSRVSWATNECEGYDSFFLLYTSGLYDTFVVVSELAFTSRRSLNTSYPLVISHHYGSTVLMPMFQYVSKMYSFKTTLSLVSQF